MPIWRTACRIEGFSWIPFLASDPLLRLFPAVVFSWLRSDATGKEASSSQVHTGRRTTTYLTDGVMQN